MPERWRADYGLRRYGFHGLSYSWALQRTAQALGRPVDDLQVVLVHLGGGCSACAVRNGRSVDTTMGLTPLEGLVMSRLQRQPRPRRAAVAAAAARSEHGRIG